MNEKEFDKLEKLTDLDDIAVDEISARYPALDDAAFKRIEKLCEKKMKNVNSTNIIEKSDHSDYVEGVERIRHIPFYRRPVFAACASIALMATAGTVLLLNLSNTSNGPDTPAPPIIATGSVTGKTTNVTTTTTTTFITTIVQDESDVTQGSDTNTTAITTEPPTTEAPTEETKSSVTNGYDIATYPTYNDYLSTHYNSAYYADYSYALYDINNDGTPELLTFFNNDKQSIHEIRDINLNSYVRSNMSASSYLCEDGTVIATQGDPPYVNCTLLNPLGNGQSDRFECLTFRGTLNIENDRFVITVYEGVESEVYHYVPTESERYGNDSFIQSELGIQTPSEDMRITLDEANEILSRYRPLSIETEKMPS